MKRLTILITCCLLSVFALEAQEQKVVKSTIIEQYKGMPYYIHFVNTGETLSAISQVYGVSTEAVLNANPSIVGGLHPNQVIKIPVKSSEQPGEQPSGQDTENKSKPGKEAEILTGTGQTHVIEPKETWYGLSRLFGIPVKDLLAANPGVDTLRIGMSINIPGLNPARAEKAPRSGYEIHQVRPQETLYSLSKSYNSTVEEIVRLNPELAEGLKTGQLIYVPKHGSQPVAPAVPIQKQELPGVQELPETQGQPTAQEQPVYIYRNHVVKRKETLYSISKQYNVGIAEILKVNPGLTSGLKKGDIVRIPEVKPKSTPVKPFEEAALPETPVEKIEREPSSPGDFRNQEFRVALLIPFLLEASDSIINGDPVSLKLPSEYQSLDFIQFYEGALLAIDSLKEAGINCKVYVYDADAGEHVSKTRKIIAKSEFSEMDLIIGPFFTKSFDLVSDFAAKHSIPLVNPLSQRSEILKDNPYVFKVQPSAWGQQNETARFIASRYPGANVIIMRRNIEENSNMAAILKSAIEKHSAGSVKVKEVIYSQSYETGLFKNMVAGRKNVLLMLTKDKALLPALLRKLNDSREKYEITLFGLPEWEDMDLDITYMQNLDTHLYNPWFVDYSQPAVKRFVEEFRNRYKTEPEQTDLAFLGYDLSFYFISSLMNYGKNFTQCLNSNDQKGLSTSFSFWKTENGGYENTAASVYQLKDYRRQVVNR